MGLWDRFRAAPPKKPRRGRGPRTADELAKMDERNWRREYFRRNPEAQDMYIRKALGIEDERDPVVKAQRAAERAIKEAEAAGHQAAARYIAEDPDIGKAIALKLVDARNGRARSPHDELRDTLALLRELREEANGDGGDQDEGGFAGSMQKYVAPLMPALLLGVMARMNPEAAGQMAQTMAAAAGGGVPALGSASGQMAMAPGRARVVPMSGGPAAPGMNGALSRPPAGLPEMHDSDLVVDADGNIVPSLGTSAAWLPSAPPPAHAQERPVAPPVLVSNGAPSPATLTPEAINDLLRRLPEMAAEDAAEALWNLFAEYEEIGEAGSEAVQRVAQIEELLLSSVPDAGVLGIFEAIAKREAAWRPLVAHVAGTPHWLAAVREQLRAIDAQARAEAGLAAAGETNARST